MFYNKCVMSFFRKTLIAIKNCKSASRSDVSLTTKQLCSQTQSEQSDQSSLCRPFTDYLKAICSVFTNQILLSLTDWILPQLGNIPLIQNKNCAAFIFAISLVSVHQF